MGLVGRPITDWRMSAPPACYHFGIVCVGPGDFTYHRSGFFGFVFFWFCGFAAVAGHILHKYDGVAAWWWCVLQWTRDTTVMS
jgi:hypothetical protein